MGSLCSKPGDTSAGDSVPLTPRGKAASKGNTLGEPSVSERSDPRAAAAQAAEERLKTAQSRGVVGSNPNRGRLAAQLEASKSAPKIPEQRQPERLVWD